MLWSKLFFMTAVGAANDVDLLCNEDKRLLCLCQGALACKYHLSITHRLAITYRGWRKIVL